MAVSDLQLLLNVISLCTFILETVIHEKIQLSCWVFFFALCVEEGASFVLV